MPEVTQCQGQNAKSGLSDPQIIAEAEYLVVRGGASGAILQGARSCVSFRFVTLSWQTAHSVPQGPHAEKGAQSRVELTEKL